MNSEMNLYLPSVLLSASQEGQLHGISYSHVKYDCSGSDNSKTEY